MVKLSESTFLSSAPAVESFVEVCPMTIWIEEERRVKTEIEMEEVKLWNVGIIFIPLECPPSLACVRAFSCRLQF